MQIPPRFSSSLEFTLVQSRQTSTILYYFNAGRLRNFPIRLLTNFGVFRFQPSIQFLYLLFLAFRLRPSLTVLAGYVLSVHTLFRPLHSMTQTCRIHTMSTLVGAIVCNSFDFISIEQRSWILCDSNEKHFISRSNSRAKLRVSSRNLIFRSCSFSDTWDDRDRCWIQSEFRFYRHAHTSFWSRLATDSPPFAVWKYLSRNNRYRSSSSDTRPKPGVFDHARPLVGKTEHGVYGVC